MVPSPYLIALFALAALTSVRAADDVYTGSTDVRFQGSSNLHPFSGSVNDIALRVRLQDGRLSMKTQVTVRDLTTDHKKRDQDMWKMFDAADYPLMQVSVQGASYEAARPQGGKPGKLPVRLTIAGKTTTVQGVTQNLVETSSGGSFDLKLTLSLKRLGLEAPAAMLGTLQVRDRVDVVCHVKLDKGA